MTAALIGASRPSQVDDAVNALNAEPLSAEEAARIDEILAGR
jgi:aryl-alcohol dehydrogenase-like predicted oxidoreductase